MPYINLRTNINEFEKKQAVLLDIIVSSIKNILRKDQGTTSVLIEKLPYKSWHINSKNTTTFILEIKIEKDTYTKEGREKLVKSIYDGLLRIESNISFVSYISIDDINEFFILI